MQNPWVRDLRCWLGPLSHDSYSLSSAELLNKVVVFEAIVDHKRLNGVGREKLLIGRGKCLLLQEVMSADTFNDSGHND